MAVVDVRPMWSNVNSNSVRVTGLTSVQWSASAGYTVLFDAISNDNAIAAHVAAGIPALGAAFSVTYPWLLCRRRRVVDPRGPLLYPVVCEFWGEESPLVALADISWGRVSSRLETAMDINGVAYSNMNGCKMYGVTRLFMDRVYRFVRNEATDAFAFSTSYANSVNSDIITLNGHAIAAGRAMMGDITAERIITVGGYYWRITYPIQIRDVPPYWRQQIECRGPKYRLIAGGTKYNTKDLHGHEWEHLKTDGTLLSDDDVDDGNYQYEYRDEFQSVAWAPIGLY